MFGVGAQRKRLGEGVRDACGGKSGRVNSARGIRERDAGRLGCSVPDILLLIPSQYLSVIADEIRYIMQLLLPPFFMLIRLHDCARDNTYLQLLGQLFIHVQIPLPLRADFSESGVFGRPICKVIFWKDGELGAAQGSARYEVGGFGKVEIRFEGLLAGRMSGRMLLMEESG